MNRVGSILVCLVLAALLHGCGQRQAPLKFEKIVELQVGDIEAFPIDAPVKDQKVSVVISSPSDAVDVYVVLEKDRAAVFEALKNAQTLDAAMVIAKAEKVTDRTLDANIPKGSEFAVILANPLGKDTKVALRITGN